MDKRKERTAIVKVFGPYASAAESAERPDFLIKHDGFVHGIEVTELYPSRIDAKLQNLPSYTTGLLDDSAQLHIKDRESLRVETITLLYDGGRKVDGVRAIIQKNPTHADKVELLLTKIEEKAAKFSNYLEQCDAVDLIIWDFSSLFGTVNDLEILSASVTESRKRFLSTPFREVFLLSRSPEPSKSFFFPIRGNLLLIDAILFDHANLESGTDVADPLRIPALAHCLRSVGHTIDYQNSPQESIHSLGWEILVNGLDVNFRNWTNANTKQPIFNHEQMMSVVPREHVELLIEARSKSHCKNIVSLEAYDT